jgi:hypothetical protein
MSVARTAAEGNPTRGPAKPVKIRPIRHGLAAQA